MLLIGSKTETFLGHPYLETAEIEFSVQEKTSSDKLYIFKKRRRKNSKRLRGFRRNLVTLRVNKISFNEDLVIKSSKLSTTTAKNN